MHYQLIIVLPLLVIFMIACIKTRKLTVPASLLAGFIGYLIIAGAGYPGLIMLGAFFIMGVLATSHKKELKANAGEQQRTASQVFANGGMAAILATFAMFQPAWAEELLLMMAASLASATADTLSSELGMVYGRNFYNILSFKREAKGLDGVVSLEGTLLGAAGTLVIAIIYGIGYGFNNKYLVIIVFAGVMGNLADSVLGATLERKHQIGNDTVNFLNTLFAALLAGSLYW
ncbi:DUF92 domain-containing protein [Chitinophaga oryziterrae]|uniref:DUF92 domain-containing protein n=1 Tax=Chitinophaga oryziterrae TaxID=1031224 RepID=A0A6N8JKJ7_9BACT|nr:DUF92 domain-containing protein [Chitinophaga oryziterrae]MVT44906.1 DUF92 domain-containing protein [Chitinophaga oryziterrae]